MNTAYNLKGKICKLRDNVLARYVLTGYVPLDKCTFVKNLSDEFQGRGIDSQKEDKNLKQLSQYLIEKSGFFWNSFNASKMEEDMSMHISELDLGENGKNFFTVRDKTLFLLAQYKEIIKDKGYIEDKKLSCGIAFVLNGSFLVSLLGGMVVSRTIFFFQKSLLSELILINTSLVTMLAFLLSKRGCFIHEAIKKINFILSVFFIVFFNIAFVLTLFGDVSKMI